LINRRELLENLRAVFNYPEDDPEVAKLAVSINKSGLKQPLIVHDLTGTVIDGSKRLAAIRSMGKEAVAVSRSNDPVEIVELLQPTFLKNPPSRARIVDLAVALHPIFLDRSHRGDYSVNWQKKHPELPPTRQFSRQMFHYLINGAESQAWVSRLQSLVWRVTEGSPEAANLLKEVRNNVMSAHQAVGLLDDTGSKFNGNARDHADQLNILQNTTLQFSGVVRAYGSVGAPIKLTRAELEPIVNEMFKARTTISAMLNQLRKEMPEDE
jgi:hypothetical protein